MTDARDKSGAGSDSVSRTTARDVPYTRGVGSESEPVPRAQRPAQLPRDPTYEAELAQVDLAVLRDPGRRTDPSTKPEGRRGYDLALGTPPESVTPESPGTRASRSLAESRSPEPPGSGGRAVASGTLLSVGTVDPRGKTERTLETPRLFFSQADAGAEAYFKPTKLPAVTVHQTLETETVKLSDSIDPRRAKTIPRLDRVALQQLAEAQPESESPMAVSRPESSFDVAASASPRWNQDEYETLANSLPSHHDGQIHASLSQFRDQAEPSFMLDGAPTRPEPLVRRPSEPPDDSFLARPESNAVPTQRDLPAHRIEASQPPPAPVVAAGAVDDAGPASEGARPTSASISAEEPERRPVWINYLVFAAALLFAVVVGLFLTRGQGRDAAHVTPPVAPKVVETVLAVPSPEPPKVAEPAVAAPEPARAEPAPARAQAPAPQKSPTSLVPAAPPALPKSGPSKSSRETIF